jgi:hypothetical protein
MAQKESYHREVVEDLNTQLTQARRQLDELTALSRDQVMSFILLIFSIYLHFHLDVEYVHGNRGPPEEPQ